jgi:hypothetical protein
MTCEGQVYTWYGLSVEPDADDVGVRDLWGKGHLEPGVTGRFNEVGYVRPAHRYDDLQVPVTCTARIN